MKVLQQETEFKPVAIILESALFEWAAKAAEIELVINDCGEFGYYTLFRDHLPQWNEWNPLTDHGDRYRLARDLKMQIDFSAGLILWGDKGGQWSGSARFTPSNDEEEGLAILSVAAEIGKTIK